MTANATAREANGQRLHFDVIIIGAGLSGIGAAAHLQDFCPDRTWTILEARGAIGGTWDLFRYPGVRSDSDMFTLGYRFRPWKSPKAIADGPSILAYVRDTAAERGIDRNIQFNTRVTALAWSEAEQLWRVEAETPAGPQHMTCALVWNCTGYYRYAAGYSPAFAGSDAFRGRIVHPQAWPEDLDYAGKRVVVIGSGATAVTLVPSMAEKAAHVTMLQRSPTWIVSLPRTSKLAAFLGRILPSGAVYKTMRFLRIAFQNFTFKMARAKPKETGERILKMARQRLPEGFDVERHLHPRYNPWEQRLCLVPDDDLFRAISDGRADIVTGEIERFDEAGVVLKDGTRLAADIIVTATGLVVEMLGGAKVSVDGRPIDFGQTYTYRGIMFSGVPNLVATYGYSNASWTLRADLIAEWTCRLLTYMNAHGVAVARPIADRPMTQRPFIELSSGYLTRAHAILPKRGDHPWDAPQDYYADLKMIRKAPIDDGVLRFEKRRAPDAAMAAAAE